MKRSAADAARLSALLGALSLAPPVAGQNTPAALVPTPWRGVLTLESVEVPEIQPAASGVRELPRRPTRARAVTRAGRLELRLDLDGAPAVPPPQGTATGSASATAPPAPSPEPAPAPTSALTPAAPARPGAKVATAPAYVDHVIEGLPPQEVPDDDEPAYDTQGWPRYLRVEARAGTEPFGAHQGTRAGVVAQAIVETPSHGVLSLDANTLADERNGNFTLRQRDLPLPGGWRAQHELGVVDNPVPSVMRQPSRVFVPSSVILGAAGQWEQPEQGWQILAAQGEAGQLQGVPVTLFQRQGGQRSRLGLQASQWPNEEPAGWSGALMLERAEQVLPTSFLGNTQRVDAQSSQVVLRHDDGDLHLQGHGVQTRNDTAGTTRNGLWVDAEWNDGPRRHTLGAYRLETGLGWVDTPLPEDLQGVYLRSLWRTRQWSVEGAVDALQTLSGRHAQGLYATGSTHWRLSRDHSLGAGLTVRSYAGQATQAFGDWRWQNDAGATGLRWEATHSSDSPPSVSLNWDQEWPMPLGYALASSLMHSREAAWAAVGQPSQQRWSGALAGAMPLGSHAQFRGNLTAQHTSLGSESWGANLGASWHFAPQWSLDGQYTRTLGRFAPGVSLDPLAPRPTETFTTASRSFFVALRYEFQAGSRNIPLGGRGQQGGGRVMGVVYFDTNRSGSQEASETGVPGVMVMLDNRYGVRTDAQGRFDFPLVAAGTHTLAVRNDSLPLPWAAADDAPAHIEVQLRGESEIAIPVLRAQ